VSDVTYHHDRPERDGLPQRTIHLSGLDYVELTSAVIVAKNSRNYRTQDLAFRRVLDILNPNVAQVSPNAPVVPIESLAPEPCEFCNGSGVRSARVYGNGDSYMDGEADCDECNGSGHMPAEG
jgi:hypothetical protein